MSKLRIVFAFAVATCALAMTAGTSLAFFKASEYPVKVSAHNIAEGEEVDFFEFVTLCTESHYYSTAALAAEGEQLKLLPEYKGCKSKLKKTGETATSTINFDHCTINLKQAKGAFEGTVTIECPKESEIKVMTGIMECSYSIPAQGPLSKVAYENLTGKPTTVGTKLRAEAIKFKPNAGCMKLGIKETESLLWFDDFQLKAQNNAGTEVGLEVA